jgi:hypothetical protein
MSSPAFRRIDHPRFPDAPPVDVACWLAQPRDACVHPSRANSAISNVPGLARNCTDPLPPDVVIVVDALPDPLISKSNDPSPPTVCLIIVSRARSVVLALHSVENDGSGHPIGPIKPHLMNGPKFDVPFTPPVIASAI